MRTVETVVYQFEELSDRAKEKAREWYRQQGPHDDWYDTVYEDAAKTADLMGIDLRTKRVNLMGGGTRLDPCIWFSGFSSQGDGACFEGTYSYKKGCTKAIEDEWPQDEKLHQIVRELTEVQRRNFYALSATISHRGHYYHSGCTEIEFDYDSDVLKDREPSSDDFEELKQILRNFMDWIYGKLEEHYNWMMSDEIVDENIVANEYEFDEDGNRF